MKKYNLNKLLYPNSIAFIGGDDTEIALKQCLELNFKGKIWAINKKRKKMGGIHCLKEIEDLPCSPDLAFIGVSKTSTTKIIKELKKKNAGAAICFAAGYAETGMNGEKDQHELISVAGEMPILGPNCYGLINSKHNFAAWPYFHGCKPISVGAALISQSGMLATSLSMNRRSTVFSHMISVGNQAMLGAEDFIEVLLKDNSVNAFALYIEGIRDINKFISAIKKSIRIGKPVVMIQIGNSTLSAQIAKQHTGYPINFTPNFYKDLENIGVTFVESPNQLLETLKVITHPILPKGLRTIAFTCSGGDAALLANIAEMNSFKFPKPSKKIKKKLQKLLPEIASIGNPLDCTTQLWGDPKIKDIFHTVLQDDYDLAIFVQDYPRPSIKFNPETDFNEARYFSDAAASKDIPAIVCSSITENLNQKVRDYLLSINTIPSQGIVESINAIVHSHNYYNIRKITNYVKSSFQ